MLNVEEDSDLRREDEENREGAKKIKVEDECLWCLLLRILKVYRSSSDSGYTLYTSKRHHKPALIMIMILIITLLPSSLCLEFSSSHQYPMKTLRATNATKF